MKQCKKCKQTKVKTEFYKNNGKKDGIDCVCKSCRQEHRRQPQINDKLNNRYLEKNYNINLNNYNELLASQNNCCAICLSTHPGLRNKRFSVDHNHTTNQIRGLLCHSCNSMLGHAKDDINVLSSAMHYLSRKA
jgi:hypothetical protein